ncbi:MAG: hypothetical protein BGO69_15735 [Bacteroidetes bacterium 46-16]|nr:MAG: hypothetical protein BGO69_15735 [Bacteroidetes bacterium 46-16]
MEDLKKHLESTKLIVFTAQECMKIVDSLMKTETDRDRRFIKRNGYFSFDAKIHWRTVVMELCKLYNHTETFNLKTLLWKLESEHPELGFTTDQLRGWQLKIKALNKAIDNLLEQRNGVYAHLDENFDTVAYTATRPQANALILVAQEIVDTLHNRIIGSHLDIADVTGSPVLELEKVINGLQKKWEYDREFYRSHCKDLGIDPDTIEDLRLEKTS